MGAKPKVGASDPKDHPEYAYELGDSLCIAIFDNSYDLSGYKIKLIYLPLLQLLTVPPQMAFARETSLQPKSSE